MRKCITFYAFDVDENREQPCPFRISLNMIERAKFKRQSYGKI